MTDTKESNYQDRADMAAENARLRAENEEMRHALDKTARLEADLAAARKELDALRATPSDEEVESAITELIGAHRIAAGVGTDPFPPGFVASKREKLVALMRRATAAPAQSALREGVEQLRVWLEKSNRETYEATARLDAVNRWIETRSCAPNSGAGRLLADLVALMARARDEFVLPSEPLGQDVILALATRADRALAAAPEAKEQPDEPRDPGLAWVKGWNAHVAHAALNAQPIAVPDDVRKSAEYWVQRFGTYANPEEKHRRAYDCARFILSLPTPRPDVAPSEVNPFTAVEPDNTRTWPSKQPAAALGDTRRSERAEGDAELQRLLDNARRCCKSVTASIHDSQLFNVVEALARKAGAS